MADILEIRHCGHMVIAATGDTWTVTVHNVPRLRNAGSVLGYYPDAIAAAIELLLTARLPVVIEPFTLAQFERGLR